MDYSKHLFWDIDPAKLDLEKHSLFIFERVANRGSLEDWKKLIEFYGKDKACNLARQIKYADRKTLNFLSLYFDVPKEEFRCSTKTQYLTVFLER